jgi:hypothetical protein
MLQGENFYKAIEYVMKMPQQYPEIYLIVYY